MTHQPSSPQAQDGRRPARDPWEDEAETEDFKPLTPEEAVQWRARQPDVSAWRVVRWQLILLALMTLAAMVFFEASPVGWSVFYGGLCIVLPTALMAYGLTSSAWSRWRGASRPKSAGSALAGVFFWEGVKILLALAMLWLAPRIVPDLSWLGLVVGLVVVLKAYWLAFWMGRSRREHVI
ncbi:ATP synthase subunit I [Tepidicella baoligensis]|uniref:ATP synthase subunit I n=1 Tax=Tepidicella baoligensis TaxID=2707016 RepID=UPI0015DA7706|nr:ATP synthase subunit I [Tepidicella baoligensis]